MSLDGMISPLTWPPSQVGEDWDVLDCLGQGGCAKLFYARHNITHQDVVVKFDREGLRLAREAQVLKALDDGSCRFPKFIDYEEYASGAGALVMEKLGSNLMDWSAENKVTVSYVLSVADQLASSSISTQF